MALSVFVKGAPVQLKDSSFKGAGGEGSVYIQGKTAYKIYADPNMMIPLGKIQELSNIKNNNVIKPLDLITNKSNSVIGYTMNAVQNAYSLVQLFPKAFKDRNNLKQKQIIAISKDLQQIMHDVHQSHNLIVDANENNFLVSQDFKTVYGIDVDSYQTPNFRATAIMTSIRDPHCNQKWDTNTDWYAWGIQVCQLILGVHPYKGFHPKIKGFEARMEQNISIFNQDVSLPATVMPFDYIPTELREWMIAVYEKGKRMSPPSLADGQNVIFVATKIKGSNNFIITELHSVHGDVINIIDDVIVTNTAIYYGARNVLDVSTPVHIITTNSLKHLAVKIQDGKLKICDIILKTEIPVDINADDIQSISGRVYIKNGENLFEIIPVEIGNKIFFEQHLSGGVLQATKLFEGCAQHHLLGACYFNIFKSSKHTYNVKINELNKYRVVDAKYEHGVLIVLSELNGVYNRHVIRFDQTDWSYDMRTTTNVTFYSPNIVVLDSGAVVMMTDNDELEIFSNKKDSTQLKTIQDPAIKSDCKLFKNGQKAMFARNDKIYSFTMGKPS